MKSYLLRLIIVLGLLLLATNAVNAQSFENSIYAEVDALVAAPSEEKLNKLQTNIPVWSQQAAIPKDHMALVILQCTMGYHFQRLNQTGEAIAQYEDAWQRFENQNLQGYDITEYCLKPLGNLYIKTGAFSQAENTITSYIFLAEQQNNQAQQIAGIINLSVVYHNTGNYQRAINLLQQALQQSGISAVQKQKLENNLATNLIALQEYDKAQQLVGDKVTVGNDINVLKNSAQIAIRNGDYTKAEHLLNRAHQLLKRDTTAMARDQAKFFVEKAQLHQLQGDDSSALQMFHQSLQALVPSYDASKPITPSQLYAENTFLEIFDGMASLTNDANNKMTYYYLGIEVAKHLWQGLPDQQAKILHQSAQHLRYERMLEVLYTWYEASQEQEIIDEAFRYSEASKASILQQSQYQQHLRLLHPDDSDLQEEAHLQQRQETLINQISVKQGAGESVQALLDSLNRTQLQLEDLKRTLSKRYPKPNEHLKSIERLQQQLTDNNAQMMHYFFGKNYLYVFHLSGEHLQWKRFEMNEHFRLSLSSFIDYFDRPNLINDNPMRFAESSFQLFKLLGLDMLSEEKKVLVITDGLLYFVPFDALLTAPTTAFEYAQMPFLTLKHSVFYATSTSSYTNHQLNKVAPKVLGMFPVFEGTDRSLTYSVEEAIYLDNTLPTTLFKNAEATEANFLANANEHSILHISTHASGGDFVTPAHIEFIDQTIEVPELYALHMSPQLIVLSACETGIGRVQKGEGAMSLSRGFQYAGSRNILFTLWQVNDQTTAHWMQLFYENLSQNGNAFQSQYEAKIAYLSDASIPNAKKSPYYWSAFTYFGTDQPLFSPQSNNVIWMIIGILVILLVLILIIRSKLKHQPNL